MSFTDVPEANCPPPVDTWMIPSDRDSANARSAPLIVGSDVTFLDPEEQVLSLAGGLVGGDFLDAEIFGLSFECAAGARQVGSEVRKFGRRFAPCAAIG